MNDFKEIIILKEDFSYVVKKQDVWLVYTKNKEKPWICCVGGLIVDSEFYTLILAKKGKSE